MNKSSNWYVTFPSASSSDLISFLALSRGSINAFQQYHVPKEEQLQCKRDNESCSARSIYLIITRIRSLMLPLFQINLHSVTIQIIFHRSRISELKVSVSDRTNRLLDPSPIIFIKRPHSWKDSSIFSFMSRVWTAHPVVPTRSDLCLSRLALRKFQVSLGKRSAESIASGPLSLWYEV